MTDPPRNRCRTAELTETTAALFDELGLHGYGAICRSEETTKVHAAFDRSDAGGRNALRTAMKRAGVDAPDTDDFGWSSVMPSHEAQARSAVEAALDDSGDPLDRHLVPNGNGRSAAQAYLRHAATGPKVSPW